MNVLATAEYNLYWLKENCFFADVWKEFVGSPEYMQAIVLLTLRWNKGCPYVLSNPKKEEEHWVILPTEFSPARKSSIGAGASFGAPFQVVVCSNSDEAIAPFLSAYFLHTGKMDKSDQSIVEHGMFAIQQSFLTFSAPSLYRWCFSIDADAMVVCKGKEPSRSQGALTESSSPP